MTTGEAVVEARIINQAFTWNDLRQLASLGYPNDTMLADAVEPPRTVSYTYANAALTAVPSYLSSISYHSNGMVNTVTHANGTKVVHGKDANDMARPASITLQRVSDSAVLWQTGAYAYDGVGNIKTLGSDWFTYDPVNRLTVGTASAGALRQCTSYNAFGALTGLGTGTTSCTASAISVDAATNRLASPVTYDAAGSMTAWGGKTYTWTRENRMLTTTGTGINRSYVYTSDGERVLDRNNLDSTRTLWIRDLSGKVLREYARTGGGVWSWSKDYVLRDGQQAATVTAAATRHLHLDHLGTVRRMTDTQATPQLVTTASRDLYPFGLEATSSTDPERMRFTGHQRDTQGTTTQADDVDYMHARYYNPTVGRFLSVDPGRDVDPKVPQAWNMYAYVRNNPVNKVDPDGKLAILAFILGKLQTDQGGKTQLVPMPPEQQKPLVDGVILIGPGVLTVVTPLSITGVAAKGATPALTGAGKTAATLKEALGVFPQKIGAGGRLQPYSALTGQYVSPAATLESKLGRLAVSPPGQFTIGFVEGVAKGYVTGTEAPLPATRAGQIGQQLGEILGHILESLH